ncbi:putative feruloyl esterase b precursor protein [Botrytis fragariae]|uniref:Carboxylic ester hydrolase n=1 Tax=Botrytis fragariae TaxID=1964551 RepID=A0A8H6EPG5_9HELO|nr:putative feruloyl esterase b precursor protein [Botrytis fragariae]KAF5879405.1 putative feruloyl esterase b precursor protein [Botrytis fragariae]
MAKLLLLSLAALATLSHALTPNCSVAAAFEAIVPPTATVVLVQEVSQNATFAVPVADTGSPTDPARLPALYAVQIEMSTESGTTFNYGLFLPKNWTGRFLASGNSGFAGAVNYLEMGAGASYGFAAMSTDTGHDSSIFGNDSWAFDPESVTDWAWRAMHLSVVAAKEVVEEVEEYPDDFDGALVGAPAWWTVHLQLWNVQTALYNYPTTAAGYTPNQMFSVIAAESLKQCDPQDGVTDNIISDPRGCHLLIETLLCSGNSTTGCLTPAQLDTLYHYYNDWVTGNQTFVFPHFEIGSEGLWGGALNPGNATADNFDLSPFYEKGSKIIHYHGMADNFIAIASSVYFYEHVLRTEKSQGVDLDDFHRLFLVPGMEHCSGTPSTQNAPCKRGFDNAQHDVLLALIDWVENDTAPTQVIATEWNDEATLDHVTNQRPICMYPQQAKYIGTGNTSVATNWECQSIY